MFMNIPIMFTITALLELPWHMHLKNGEKNCMSFIKNSMNTLEKQKIKKWK